MPIDRLVQPISTSASCFCSMRPCSAAATVLAAGTSAPGVSTTNTASARPSPAVTAPAPGPITATCSGAFSSSASLRPAPSISNVMSATSPLRCSARIRIPFAMVVTP